MFANSRLRRVGGRWILIVITGVGFGAAISQVDLASLWVSLRNVSVISLFVVAGALFIGALLATFRLKLIAADIGYPLSMRDAMAAMSVGQIAGTIFFQFFGQIAARSALLGSRGLSVPANIMITTYERLIAFGVSATLAIAGAWFLFGRVAIELQSGGDKFLRILAGLAVATMAGAMLAWGRIAIKAMRPFMRRRMLFVFGRTMAITLIVQLATALAYVLAAKSIVPEANTVEVLAASTVVMFAASLPISFSGWGVREISAVMALSVIGVPAGAALTISIMIGVLALVSVIALAAFALAAPATKQRPRINAERSDKDKINIDSLVAWALPLSAATAVFFQLHIPSGGTFINVNLADPIAILCGAIFVIMRIGKSWPRWRLPDLNLYIVTASAVIVISYIHGYFAFGWSDWAFKNKLLGWFVLIGYGATGALLVHRAGRFGLTTLMRTFIVVAAAIVVLDLAILVTVRALILPVHFVKIPIEGFSQNRNAFSFLLLLAICGAPFLTSRARPWLLAALFLGIWFSGSRAIGGALIIVVATMITIGVLSIRDFLRAALIGGTAFLIIAVMPFVAGLILQHPHGDQYLLWMMGASPEISTIQRWNSIVHGVEMFWNNPIFGAGLGAYMEAQIKAGEPLVIHSTPIWLLAETGIFGLTVFALPVIRLLFTEALLLQERVGAFLILIIVAFVITSAVHELLYQRAFWLLLGAAVAYVPAKRAQSVPASSPQAAGEEYAPKLQSA